MRSAGQREIGPPGLPQGSLHLFITHHPPWEANTRLRLQTGSACGSSHGVQTCHAASNVCLTTITGGNNQEILTLLSYSFSLFFLLPSVNQCFEQNKNYTSKLTPRRDQQMFVGPRSINLHQNCKLLQAFCSRASVSVVFRFILFLDCIQIST